MADAKRVSNGWTDKASMQPRPFRKCPSCARPLAGPETRCYECAQTDKGLNVQTTIIPQELPDGDARPGKEGQ